MPDTPLKSIQQLLQKMRVLPSVSKEQVCKNDMCRYSGASKEQITALTLPGPTSLSVLPWKRVSCPRRFL